MLTAKYGGGSDMVWAVFHPRTHGNLVGLEGNLKLYVIPGNLMKMLQYS